MILGSKGVGGEEGALNIYIFIFSPDADWIQDDLSRTMQYHVGFLRFNTNPPSKQIEGTQMGVWWREVLLLCAQFVQFCPENFAWKMVLRGCVLGYKKIVILYYYKIIYKNAIHDFLRPLVFEISKKGGGIPQKVSM